MIATLTWVTYFAGLFVTFIAAVIAFARFRTTPSGLLIGTSLTLMSIIGAFLGVVDQILVHSIDTLIVLDTGRIAVNVALWLFIAAGVVLIPRSLEILAKSN